MAADFDPLMLENQLCFAVYSTAHAFNRLYRQELAALGLTYPQYLVLLVLWQEAPLPVKAIGDRLLLDSGTLTPLLKRMETQDLITRQRAKTDERQVLIGLTPAGRALREQALRLPPAVACATGMDLDKLRELVETLTALRRHVLGSIEAPESDDGPEIHSAET
jgi:DNA-binding MarR family transcriptional regulator